MTVSLTKLKLGYINKTKFDPLNYRFEQISQNLENLYFEDGQLYISDIKLLKKNRKMIFKNVYPYLTQGIESLIDIDNLDDFKFAEIFQNKYGK